MTGRRSARLGAQAGTKTGDKIAPMPPPPPPASKSRKRKASSPAPAAVNGEVSTPAPSTPKRRTQKTTIPPPATPTPSAVGLMAEPAVANTPTASPSSSVTTPKPKSHAVARLAHPKATNAPLLSPETSRVVASKPTTVEASPTPSSQHKTTTTANILAEACAHLTRTEPRLKPLSVRPAPAFVILSWGNLHLPCSGPADSQPQQELTGWTPWRKKITPANPLFAPNDGLPAA